MAITEKRLQYRVGIEWIGNIGTGTKAYSEYLRDHLLHIAGKPDIVCSSDAQFRGDPHRPNPEELLVASLSACHMLWYLHLCANAGIVVSKYLDSAEGTLELRIDGGGRFSEVVLRPRVTVESGDRKLAEQLHDQARSKCFIANSVDFPVRHEPEIEVS